MARSSSWAQQKDRQTPGAGGEVVSRGQRRSNGATSRELQLPEVRQSAGGGDAPEVQCAVCGADGWVCPNRAQKSRLGLLLAEALLLGLDPVGHLGHVGEVEGG
eukprot:EG_transcript_36699